MNNTNLNLYYYGQESSRVHIKHQGLKIANGRTYKPCAVHTHSGSCIALGKCPILYEQFKVYNELTRDEKDFIKNSQCGFDSNGEDLASRVLVCCPRNSDQCGVVEKVSNSGSDGNNRTESMIAIPDDAYPWMAVIEHESTAVFITDPNIREYLCGGSLINSMYVLTAAHCLTDAKWKARRVWLGHWDSNSPNAMEMEIEENIIHPKYGQNSYHDIALVRMKTAVEVSKFIRPICLPLDGHLNSVKLTDTLAEFASWGPEQKNFGIKTTSKFKMYLKVWDTRLCRKRYIMSRREINLDYELCAGGEEGVDTCRGDSGGALMHSMHKAYREKVYFVIGVMSFGIKQCGSKGWPSVSIEVQSHLPWILSNWRRTT
uniref:CLIP domain-containing serine protease n=1 Tax=Musca domestica TaxID=7370 RepID=A0A1I8M2J3_MUSDO